MGTRTQEVFGCPYSVNYSGCWYSGDFCIRPQLITRVLVLRSVWVLRLRRFSQQRMLVYIHSLLFGYSDSGVFSPPSALRLIRVLRLSNLFYQRMHVYVHSLFLGCSDSGVLFIRSQFDSFGSSYSIKLSTSCLYERYQIVYPYRVPLCTPNKPIPITSLSTFLHESEPLKNT